MLDEARRRGIEAQREWGRRAGDSRWGHVDCRRLLKRGPDEVLELETSYLPQELQRTTTTRGGAGLSVAPDATMVRPTLAERGVAIAHGSSCV